MFSLCVCVCVCVCVRVCACAQKAVQVLLMCVFPPLMFLETGSSAPSAFSRAQAPPASSSPDKEESYPSFLQTGTPPNELMKKNLYV